MGIQYQTRMEHKTQPLIALCIGGAYIVVLAYPVAMVAQVYFRCILYTNHELPLARHPAVGRKVGDYGILAYSIIGKKTIKALSFRFISAQLAYGLNAVPEQDVQVLVAPTDQPGIHK